MTVTRYHSPLRYPGGKASLTSFLAATIALNDLNGCSYFEPFAGGAGAALGLLQRGVVSELFLNDLDTSIVAFWRSVLDESERFVEAINTVPLTIDEWKKQRSVYRAGDTDRPFDLGFSTFYLNRCSRSGLLRNAGPIGGHGQSGPWKIDARFNRKALADRIRSVALSRERIHLSNLDARAFLVCSLPRGLARRRVFAYLDPPYYTNGRRLYLSSYNDADHRALARYMRAQKTVRWVMSYDDSEFIRRLYGSCVVSRMSLQYSLQRRIRANELLVAPEYLSLPVTSHQRRALSAE